jgi:hypothetical protein
VLALVLAGGTTATAARLTYDTSTAAPPTASATCAPLPAWVQLDLDGLPERRQKLEAILAGPEITSVHFEGRTAGILSWTFTIRCADDFPAVEERLIAVPVTGLSSYPDLKASADPSGSVRPGETVSLSPPPPVRVCDSNGCTPFTPTGSGSASHR